MPAGISTGAMASTPASISSGTMGVMSPSEWKMIENPWPW